MSVKSCCGSGTMWMLLLVIMSDMMVQETSEIMQGSSMMFSVSCNRWRRVWTGWSSLGTAPVCGALGGVAGVKDKPEGTAGRW